MPVSNIHVYHAGDLGSISRQAHNYSYQDIECLVLVWLLNSVSKV